MKVATPNDGASDQRATARVPVTGHLAGHVLTQRCMVVREISPTGARVDLDGPLQLNTLHELRLSLGADALVVRGRVVHCGVIDVEHEHVTYRAGLEFVELSSHAALIIAQFVEALQAGQLDAWAHPQAHLTAIDLSAT